MGAVQGPFLGLIHHLRVGLGALSSRPKPALLTPNHLVFTIRVRWGPAAIKANSHGSPLVASLTSPSHPPTGQAIHTLGPLLLDL